MESTAKECLWIMKGNLPKDQMVHWHQFNETEEMAREVEASYSNVVFGVALAILKFPSLVRTFNVVVRWLGVGVVMFRPEEGYTLFSCVSLYLDAVCRFE